MSVSVLLEIWRRPKSRKSLSFWDLGWVPSLEILSVSASASGPDAGGPATSAKETRIKIRYATLDCRKPGVTHAVHQGELDMGLCPLVAGRALRTDGHRQMHTACSLGSCSFALR